MVALAEKYTREANSSRTRTSQNRYGARNPSPTVFLQPKNRGPARKNRILSTKYLDDSIEWYYYGYRYYSPALGRWPSRDPIGERGGLNVYGFVKNDAVDAWDFQGLWSEPVRYKEFERAYTYNGDDGPGTDLLSYLAELIHLDAGQAFGDDGWLRDLAGNAVDGIRGIKRNCWYSVPNVVHITQGDGGVDSPIVVWPGWLKGRKDEMVEYYEGKNYHVKDHSKSFAEGQNPNSVRTILKNDFNIYVWAHFGHGVGGADSGDLVFWNSTTTTKNYKSPSFFETKFRLSEVVLYSCKAGVKADEWLERFVAYTGKLWANDGTISLPLWPPWSKYKGLNGTTQSGPPSAL